MPPLAKAQELKLLELKKEQKFTQPPPRYSEASLVRELEEKGIGRPSTYAAIISTLIDRDYARLEDKHFVPSELGETVSDLLAEHFAKIMACWEGKKSFPDAVRVDPAITAKLDPATLDALFDPTYYLAHEDLIYTRVFG